MLDGHSDFVVAAVNVMSWEKRQPPRDMLFLLQENFSCSYRHILLALGEQRDDHLGQTDFAPVKDLFQHLFGSADSCPRSA